MSRLFVDKSIQINAPASKAWETLTLPNLTQQWVSYFQPQFTKLESAWRLGSPVQWKIANDTVCVDGIVTLSEPHYRLSYTVHDVSGKFDGMYSDKDGISYELSGGVYTTLRVKQGDFWENAGWGTVLSVNC